MNTNPIINSHPLLPILEFENTPQILDFPGHGEAPPFWPIFRSEILWKLQSMFLGINHSFGQYATNKHVYYGKRFFSGLRSMPGSLHRWPHRSVAYLSNRIPKMIPPLGYYDSFEQPTAELLADDTIYISYNQKGLPVTTKIMANRSIKFPLDLRKFIATLVPNKELTKSALDFYFFLVERLRVFNPEYDPEFILPPKRVFINKVKRSAAATSFFMHLLDKVKPKVLFVANAFDGGNMEAVYLANRYSIPSCEIQHGLICDGSVEFNVSQALFLDSRYQYCVPKYFLIFSDFWRSFFHSPSSTKILGNPWFSIRKQNFSHCRHQENLILFCARGDGQDLLESIQKAITAFPGRVVVRPHPLYTSELLNKFGGKIFVDTCADIFESLSRAEVVISDFSMTLFDAASFGKRVFMLRSKFVAAYLDAMPFEQFSSGEELVEKIANPFAGRISSRVRESVYEDHWRERYLDIIESLLLRVSQ